MYIYKVSSTLAAWINYKSIDLIQIFESIWSTKFEWNLLFKHYIKLIYFFISISGWYYKFDDYSFEDYLLDNNSSISRWMNNHKLSKKSSEC